MHWGRRSVTSALLLLLAFLLAGTCRAGPKAFDIAEAQFFQRVHRVAVTPCKFPMDFSTSDTLVQAEAKVTPLVDSAIVARLREAGLEVLPGLETKAVYDGIVDSLGGLFDEVTGQQDSARTDLAEKLTREAIAARGPIDAWIYPIVYATPAAFAAGSARWHGVTQKIINESTMKGMMKALTGRTMDSEYEGTIPALSLYVAMVDPDQTSLYSWSGGIHVTSTLKNGKFAPLPQPRYFEDPERILRATEKALEPFSKTVRKRAGKP